MSYVLALKTPVPALQALAGNMIALALTYPEQTQRGLPGGLTEIDTTKAELGALATAELGFRDSQREETEAREAKDLALQASQAWFSPLREKGQVVAKHETDASKLGRVLAAIPPASRLRESELPNQMAILASVVAAHAEPLARIGYDASAAAEGDSLAAALRDALERVGVRSSERTAALTARDEAREALVRRLRRLDDFLGLALPGEGKLRLESLRRTWLPLQGTPSPELAEDPAAEDEET